MRGYTTMIKILFVCHGNICRSTMAESVFTDMVDKLGVVSQFEIDSAATSREEIGNAPHYGTRAKLAQVGIPVVPHRARQMTQKDYEYYDYLIGMDSANIRNMKRIAGNAVNGEKIYKMLRAGKSEQKAEFALDVIFEISPDELSVPPYINQGLMWLQDYLHPED